MAQNWWDKYEDAAPSGGPAVISGGQRQPAPVRPVQEAIDQATLTGKRNDNANAEALARKAEAEAETARLKAAEAARDAARGGLTPIQVTERNDRAKMLLNFENNIEQLNGLYERNLKGPEHGAILGLGGDTNWAGNLPDWMKPSNQTFRDKGQSMLGTIAGVQGVTGGEMNSLAEMKARFGPLLPAASDNDENIQFKIDSLKAMADEQRRILGLPERDWSKVVPPSEQADKSRRLVGDGEQSNNQQLSKNGTRSVEDPVLRALSIKIGAMVAGGKPDKDILEYMQRAGVNPAETNIGQTLQYRRTNPEFKQWKLQNPGKAYPVGKSFYTKEVPLSQTSNLINSAAQSDVGAYFMGAGNAVTGNRYDNIAEELGGNGEQIKAGMDLMRAEHPISSMAGDITGTTLNEMALGRIKGVGKFAETPWGRRGIDTLNGIWAGSGENDENPIMGAVTGGIANTAGGSGGRAAQRGLGSAMTGVKDEGLRYLHDRGVDLTLGQMLRSGKGVIPRIAANAESRLRGLPVTREIIAGADERGAESFNRAAFDEGMLPGGGVNGGRTGADAVANMSGQGGEVAQAYSRALDGVVVQQDRAFTNQLNRAVTQGTKNPRHGGDFQHILDNEIKPLFGQSGELTGENLQAAIQILRGHQAAYKGQPLGNEMNAALRNVETALTGMVRRQAPKVMPALDAANAMHRNSRILAKGVTAGKNTGDLFTAGQLNQASVANTTKYGGLTQAASPDRPFYQLGKYGQDILPDKIRETGTAGNTAFANAMLPAFLTGAGGAGGAALSDDRAGGGAEGAGYGLLAAAALALPYSKGGQRALQRLVMAPRLKQIDVVGEAIKKYPWIGGLFGGGMARDAALYPELSGEKY